MMVELDEDEARLLYAVVLEKAQEHFSYANASESRQVSKLAVRLARPSRDSNAVTHSYMGVGVRRIL